jgi:uncharacterized membrane protein YkvA (DUF1232 family)
MSTPNKAKEDASRSLLTHGMTLLEIAREYWKGNYREVPKWAIGAIVASLVYVVSPLDFIPEIALGPLGVVDDVFVLGLAMKLINDEVRRFTGWKEKQAGHAPEGSGKIVDV